MLLRLLYKHTHKQGEQSLQLSNNQPLILQIEKLRPRTCPRSRKKKKVSINTQTQMSRILVQYFFCSIVIPPYQVIEAVVEKEKENHVSSKECIFFPRVLQLSYFCDYSVHVQCRLSERSGQTERPFIADCRHAVPHGWLYGISARKPDGNRLFQYKNQIQGLSVHRK